MIIAINKQKNKIILTSFILIVLAFINHYLVKIDYVSEIALIIASIIGAVPIILQAIGALRYKIVSIDVLVSIAVVGAFIIRNYEESAIVTFLFLFGAFLEQKTLNKTKDAIKELVELRPKTAYKKIDGEYVLVNVSDVKVNDYVLIKTGDQVPVDGEIIKGSGQINEASITGESMPVEKSVKSFVYAGTILDNGTIEVKALKVGEDTTFGKIIELVEEASDSKSKTEKFINRFSLYYTPVVLLIALVVGIVTKDIELAITILVLGCPGALVIGVPVSNVSGIGNGARNGVLLKGSETISALSKTTTMIFDKTGTITTGKPEIEEVIYYTNDKGEAAKYLYSIERESNHPLAKAVTNYFKDLDYYKVTNTNVVGGFGIKAVVNGSEVVVGSGSLMESEGFVITETMENDIEKLVSNGNSIIMLAIDKEIKLVLGIKDQIRENIKEDLENLRKMGIKNLVLLSGDNQKVVDLVKEEVKMTIGIGGMLPEDKANYVKMLMEQGEIVTFVGDGINDSPSIALADVGIAIGSGTDVAIETSDVVLMKSDFKHLRHAYGLSKSIMKNTISNIVIALAVVAFLMFGLIFGEFVTMSIGMLVHEGSILVVILNGMRLLRYKLKKER